MATNDEPSRVTAEAFYDRSVEIEALRRAWSRRTRRGQMMLLFGRRRIGKTFLLQHFFTAEDRAGRSCYYLAEQTSAREQLRAAAERVLTALPAPNVRPEDLAVSWRAILRHVSSFAGSASFGLVLDEFPYLVDQTPDLPSILHSWWDTEGIRTRLLVVLCGSQMSAMAALGHQNAPLYGRFDAGIVKLEPMRYYDVAEFYRGNPRYEPRDILTMYGALGGTPRYHAMVDPDIKPAAALVDLIFQSRAPLENEPRYLLASEQIRDAAPYNAALTAIASGETEYGKILNRTGLTRGSLDGVLQNLMELDWIRRERPYGERSDKRSLYVASDPFLSFWYHFVAPLASDLAFSSANAVWHAHVAPGLAGYMGRFVFESICRQWLERRAVERLGLTLRLMGRYWSRDGQIELDVVGKLDTGDYLFGECRWKASGSVGLDTLLKLQSKVLTLPDAAWRNNPTYVLFTTGTFARELREHAKSQPRLHLVGIDDLMAKGVTEWGSQ